MMMEVPTLAIAGLVIWVAILAYVIGREHADDVAVNDIMRRYR